MVSNIVLLINFFIEFVLEMGRIVFFFVCCNVKLNLYVYLKMKYVWFNCICICSKYKFFFLMDFEKFEIILNIYILFVIIYGLKFIFFFVYM